MILKILEKLGRKKMVLDRGPSHPEFDKAKPWLERYYLLFRRRPKCNLWLAAAQNFDKRRPEQLHRRSHLQC